MRSLRCFVLAFLPTLAMFSLPAAAPTGSALGLRLAPCTIPRTKIAAQCGTYGVYENRAARSGRVIQLRVLVLRARHPAHRAIAWIEGGPGGSSVDDAEYIARGLFEKEIAALRDRYDVVFADDRGMGASHPFDCDDQPAGRPQVYFKNLFPSELIRRCRARDAATHDLNQYNTNATVDDLDELRGALGYPKIVLDGGSYGTFFSLVYMRRHPGHVESAVLDGVAPPHFQPLPGAPDGAQAALTDLIAKCRSDAACRRNFPQFAEHFQELLHRFDKGPLSVDAVALPSHKTQHVLLSKEVFVDHLRQTLYAPEGAAFVPYVTERAYRGDFKPLSRLIEFVALNLGGGLNEGAYLSYSCADFMPFISNAQLKHAAATSFTGDLRVRAQRAACAIWNVAPMPPAFNDPVRSSVPALLITGSDDPATPPQSAASQMKYLSNAKEVIVRGAGHGAETPCVEKLVEAFVRANSARGLDTSKCSASFSLPKFETSAKGIPLP